MSEYCRSIKQHPSGARHTLGPPAAPADSHVDGSDGPGWDRDTIAHAVVALTTAGDVDLGAAVVKLLADRDRIGREAMQEHHRADYAESGRNAAGRALAQAATERDQLADRLNEAYRQRDLARGELNAAQRELATARRAAIGLSAGLEAARRDAAADALDWAAGPGSDSPPVTALRRWAAEVRAGTRSIPPADRT